MVTTFRNDLREVMKLAWRFVHKNGYTMSEALKTAWVNIKLRAALSRRVAMFQESKPDNNSITETNE